MRAHAERGHEVGEKRVGRSFTGNLPPVLNQKRGLRVGFFRKAFHSLFRFVPSLDPLPPKCYRSAPDCVSIGNPERWAGCNVDFPPRFSRFASTCDGSVYGAWTHETTPLPPLVRYLIAGWLLFVESFSPNKPKEPGDTPDDQPHKVGDLAIPFGMFPVKLEAVGLVSGLHGTGSDPEPSPQRAMLMSEMQRRGVENPNQLLATRNFSLVLVRGFLRPGIQKGDHFDVEVRVKDRSETTSLRGGYLLETHLSDLAVIYGKVLNGKDRGLPRDR